MKKSTHLTTLGNAQQKVLEAVLSTPESGLIPVGSYPILAAYCEAVVDLEALTKDVSRRKMSSDEYIKLTRLKIDMRRSVASLAARLRLTPSSVHRREADVKLLKESDYDEADIYVDI